MRTRTVRSTVVAGAALCVTAIGGLSTADGHQFNAKTTVVVTEVVPTGAAGTISSPRKACLAGREVTLFRQQGRGGRRIGTDLTDAEGNWAVEESLLAGTYYARVSAETLPAKPTSAKKKRKKRHSHKCKAGVSAPREG
jgi:hypothetical protein